MKVRTSFVLNKETFQRPEEGQRGWRVVKKAKLETKNFTGLSLQGCVSSPAELSISDVVVMKSLDVGSFNVRRSNIVEYICKRPLRDDLRDQAETKRETVSGEITIHSQTVGIFSFGPRPLLSLHFP